MPFLAQKHMKTAENRLVLGLFSLFFLFLQSCSAPPVLDELNTFENNRWHMDSTITVEWAPQDAETPVFMGMYVRHLSDYPYNNLYLFRTIRSSQGVEYSDTVNIALAESRAIRLGDYVPAWMSACALLQLECLIARAQSRCWYPCC